MKLLVATDLSERSDTAIARAVLLAKTVPADITVLYVIESALPDEVARALQDTAEPLLRKRVSELSGQGDVDVTIQVKRGQDWALISEVAQQGSFDVVVMGTHRHTGRETTRGSTIDRVIRVSGRPVLVVKNPVTEPYRRVLAAVDFSLPSRHAAGLAETLVANATVRLMHVCNGPLAGMFSGESEEDRTNRLKEMLIDEAPDMSVIPDIVVQKGDVIGDLYDEARNWPADLLALGTHGRTGVGLAMLGSVAEQFLAMPPCDLLIVKAW